MGEKEKSAFWQEDTGKNVAKAAWTGTKAVGVVVVAGLALGLGLGAYSSVSAS